MLEIIGLTARYGDLPVVKGINLCVTAGELVTLSGPQGAGKTTTMLAISGDVPSTGRINFQGQPLTGPHCRRVRRGVGFVSQDRAVCRQRSTRANLERGLGGLNGALEIFPELEALLELPAGFLSAGEQQMLIVARALAAGPRLLLVDELSLGLEPVIVQRLLAALRSAANSGTAVLMCERHVDQSRQVADRGYLLARGEIELEGSGVAMRSRTSEVEQRCLSTV